MAVVVLSYEGREDTLACLASLARSRWDSLSTIVVDNGSRDGTVEEVAARYPDVCLVAHGHNVGFAEGNNIGIRRALELGAEYVLLLNNDTRIDPDTIVECLKVAEQHPDAGAVCPLILFAEPANLVWYAGAVFDPRRARSGRMLGYREFDRGQFQMVGETDRATGAAVLLSGRALREIGLLDSELFFLYEDVDWSLRARRSGYRIFVAPKAKVWHRVSAASGGEHSPLIAYYDARNHLVVCRRHAPLKGASAFIREIGIAAVHLAGARRARSRREYVLAVLRGLRDARRGSLGPRA